MKIEEIPLNKIIRPLPRQNDGEKVEALMKSHCRNWAARADRFIRSRWEVLRFFRLS